MSLHEITPSLPPSNYIVEKSTRTEDDQSLNSRETSGFKAQTTRDEATISPEAKLMLGMGEGDGESAKIGRWYKHVSLKKEDFAGMEDAMAMLKLKKIDARDSIKDLLEKNGVKLSGPDNLKIELNANGQAIVGGVKDAKTARKIEKLLNDSPDALKAIADYQKEERKLSAELKAKTGMSFADLKKHCENIDQGYVKVLKDRGVMYSKEEMLSFQDQDLYKVDPNLINSIKDFIAPDHSGIDFSTDSKIISNPESVLKSEMMDFTRNIKKAFDGINFSIHGE